MALPFTGAGRADQVMAALEKFTELMAEADLDPGESGAAHAGDPAAEVKPATAGEKEGLPVFLKSKNLKGNIEIAAAIVAWSQRHDGKPTASPWARSPDRKSVV